MAVLEHFDGPMAVRLVVTLLHFVWQGTLLALLAAAAARLAAKRSPSVRYAIFATSMLSMVAAVALTFVLVGPGQSMATEPAAGGHLPDVPTVGATAEVSNDDVGRNVSATPQPTVTQQPEPTGVDEKQARETTAADKPRTNQTMWRPYVPYVVTAYYVGAALMLLRLLVGLGGGDRLRRHSQPVEQGALLAAAARQARLLGLSWAPALAYSRRVTVPVVVGVIRPMILLPMNLATGLSSEQIEMILSHELAHVRRHDPLINVIQRLIEVLLFFHPALWYVSRQVRLEREHCCDDLVLGTGTEPEAYASSLVEAATQGLRRQWRQPTEAAACRATGSRSQLKHRVLRLLGHAPAEQTRLGRAWLAAWVLTAALAISAITALGRGASEPPTAEHDENIATLADAARAEAQAGWSTAPGETRWARPARLSFRIVPNAASVGGRSAMVGADEIERLKVRLATQGVGGRKENDQFGWFRVGCSLPAEAVTVANEGQQYVLLCHDMRTLELGKAPHRDWGLVKVAQTQDKQGRAALSYELDEQGAERLSQLTGQHKGMYLAVVVDETAVAAVKIEEALGGQGLIAGEFSEADVKSLVAALRRGMPAGRELHGAIRDGRLKRVKELMGYNGDLIHVVQRWPNEGDLPIHTAIRHDRPEILQFLLEQGAGVNARRPDGTTPLHLAGQYGRIDTARLLLERGADINALDGQGTAVLAGAAIHAQKQMVGWLLDQGAAIDGKGRTGLTALAGVVFLKAQFAKKTLGPEVTEEMKRALRAVEEISTLLRQRGAQVDIFAASGLGEEQRLQEILSRNPRAATSTTSFGLTPLHVAALADERVIARQLLKAGASVYAEYREVGTPLQAAAMVGNAEMVDLLKSHAQEGTPVRQETAQALREAAQSGQPEVVAQLLQDGADVNAADARQNTSLHKAAKQGRDKVTQILLKAGAQVNARNRQGETPLHLAAAEAHSPLVADKEHYAATVRLLLESGADVAARDGGDRTPLLSAMTWLRHSRGGANLEMVRLLVKHGAQVNLVGDAEQTPLIMAVNANEPALVQVLLDAGADPLCDSGPFGNYRLPYQVVLEKPAYEEVGRILNAATMPKLDRVYKEIAAVLKTLFDAIMDNDDEALYGVAVDHPHFQKGIWRNWARAIRETYAANSGLLEKIAAVGLVRDWATAYVPQPDGAPHKYMMLELLRFPDGRWRVVGQRADDHDPSKHAQSQAANQLMILDTFYNAVYDAAGQTERLRLSGSMGSALPQAAQVLIQNNGGHLRIEFVRDNSMGKAVLELHPEYVKWLRGAQNLRLSKKVTLKDGRGQGRARLRATPQEIIWGQYTIKAVDGRVSLSRDGEVVHVNEIRLTLANYDPHWPELKELTMPPENGQEPSTPE